MIASREFVKDLISKVFKLQTGEICAFMATKSPRGFLICDGSEYNIEDYKNLSRFFLDQFGSINYFGGDGITTFKVPDLRGEFLRGTGTNSHTNCGSGLSVGEHQDPTAHLLMHIGSSREFWAQGAANSGIFNIDTVMSNATLRTSASVSKSTVASQAATYSARPTNTSVLYCIRY